MWERLQPRPEILGTSELARLWKQSGLKPLPQRSARRLAGQARWRFRIGGDQFVRALASAAVFHLFGVAFAALFAGQGR